MKNYITSLFGILLILIIYNANAQPATFQKTYGGSKQDYSYDMHTTSDGGYVLGGITFSYSNFSGRCLVVKTDMNGDTIWTTNWGGTKDTNCDFQYINDLVQTNDGGIITCGGKGFCGGPYAGEAEITRLDKSGNVLWSKNGVNGAEDPYPVIEDKAGNFIVGGYVINIGAGGEDACIMKLNANGDTLWSRTYGGVGDDWFYHILQTKDGGYLGAGFTTSFGEGGKDIYLVKTDSNGKLLWSNAYGTPKDEAAFGHCLAATSDGGYILTGYGNSGSPYGLFLLKLDSLGNMNWANYYTGQNGHGIKQLATGEFLIAGTSGTSHAELIKTDSKGNIDWGKSYGGTGNESGWILDLADDGGYVTGGYTTSFGSGSEDMYLIKTDTTGSSGCNYTSISISDSVAPFIQTKAATISMVGINTANYTYTVKRGTTVTDLCFTPEGLNEIKNKKKGASIFPNPTSDVATITFSEKGTYKIELYDMTEKQIGDYNFSGKEYQIQCKGLTAGVYFIRITGEQETQTIKFIKQ